MAWWRRRAARIANGPDCAQHLSNCPKTENWRYLGLRGSKPNLKSTHHPPLFVVFNPQHRPTRHLDLGTSGHLVEPEGSPGRAESRPSGCWAVLVVPFFFLMPKNQNPCKVIKTKSVAYLFPCATYAQNRYTNYASFLRATYTFLLSMAPPEGAPSL